MKLIDIKGTSSTIRFILNDSSYFKGNGELLQNGFCVYEESLHFVENEFSRKISKQEIDELKIATTNLIANKNFNIVFAG